MKHPNVLRYPLSEARLTSARREGPQIVGSKKASRGRWPVMLRGLALARLERERGA